MSADKMRDAFEAWAVSDWGGWLPSALDRQSEDGMACAIYADDDVHAQWEAWQAATTVQAAEIARLTQELADAKAGQMQSDQRQTQAEMAARASGDSEKDRADAIEWAEGRESKLHAKFLMPIEASAQAQRVTMLPEQIEGIWQKLPTITIHNHAARHGISTERALRIAFARALLAAQPASDALNDEQVDAGCMALLQCTFTELGDYSINLMENYQDDVRRVYAAIAALRAQS